MIPTDQDLEPVLQRLKEVFKHEAEPKEYAKSLRNIFDNYALLLLEQKDVVGNVSNDLYNLKQLAEVLHEC